MISMTSLIKPARWRILANSPAESEQAALKRIYLATLALDPSGKGKVRWAGRWKEALNARST